MCCGKHRALFQARSTRTVFTYCTHCDCSFKFFQLLQLSTFNNSILIFSLSVRVNFTQLISEYLTLFHTVHSIPSTHYEMWHVKCEMSKCRNVEMSKCHWGSWLTPSEWVTEWLSDWVTEWLGEWVSALSRSLTHSLSAGPTRWLAGWWLSEWLCVCVCTCRMLREGEWVSRWLQSMVSLVN